MYLDYNHCTCALFSARAVKSQRRPRIPVLTNEDLFYDPDIDDDNELWMANKLRSHRGRVEYYYFKYLNTSR